MSVCVGGEWGGGGGGGGVGNDTGIPSQQKETAGKSVSFHCAVHCVTVIPSE